MNASVPTPNFSTEAIIFITMETIIGLVTTPTNILVFYVILSSSAFRKKPMYIFVASLAVADFLVGTIVIPFSILSMLGIPLDNPMLCIVMLIFVTIPSQISIFSLVAISLERYFAVSHPYLHLINLTWKRAISVVVITWLASCMIALLPIVWNNVDWRYWATNGTTVSMLMTIQAQNEGVDIKDIHMDFHNGRPLECMYAEILNGDYLVFKFVILGLLPLIVCGVSYSVIFLKVKKSLKINSTARRGSEGLITSIRRFVTPERMSQKNNSYVNEYETAKDSNCKRDNKTININSTKSEISESNGGVNQPKFNQDSYKKSFYLSETETEYLSDNSICGIGKHSRICNTPMNCLPKPEETKSKRSVSVTSEILLSISNLKTNYKKRLSNVASSSPFEARRSVGTVMNEEMLARQQRKKKEIHVATVLAMIVIAFAICWMPIHILNTIRRFSNDFFIPSWVFSTAVIFSHANSMVNFFLYACRLKAFRAELRQKFVFSFQRKQTTSFS